MTYERLWTVRFSDADPFGIAFYPRIVAELHETADMFVQEIGFPFWEMAADGYGLPIVEVDVEFQRPIEAGDDVRIELTPDPGTRSVRFEFVGRLDDRNEECFTGYEQRACVATDADSAMELPEDLRAALEPYADG